MMCPMCGARVRVYSADEGTNSYEPVAEAELERLRLAILAQASIARASGKRDKAQTLERLLEKPNATP